MIQTMKLLAVVFVGILVAWAALAFTPPVVQWYNTPPTTTTTTTTVPEWALEWETAIEEGRIADAADVLIREMNILKSEANAYNFINGRDPYPYVIDVTTGSMIEYAVQEEP